MPANTTALINSPIAPIGKLATRIRNWLRGSRPSTPTPIWREPPLGLACRLTGRPVSAAATHTGSHIWCKHRLRRADPIEDDAGRQAEFRHPQQFGDRLLGCLAWQWQ